MIVVDLVPSSRLQFETNTKHVTTVKSTFVKLFLLLISPEAISEHSKTSILCIKRRDLLQEIDPPTNINCAYYFVCIDTARYTYTQTHAIEIEEKQKQYIKEEKTATFRQEAIANCSKLINSLCFCYFFFICFSIVLFIFPFNDSNSSFILDDAVGFRQANGR